MTLADFCPYVQEFTWKSEDKTSRGTRCTDYSNQPSDDNNYALEDYGEGSMCFDQAGPWQQKSCAMLKQWQRYGAGISFSFDELIRSNYESTNLVVTNICFDSSKLRK